MRVVQAHYWLRDGLKNGGQSDQAMIRAKLARLLREPRHGRALREDLNAGLVAKPEDRRDLFLAAANRLGTTLQNVEKDFRVCWVPDWLFSGRKAGGPRLLFKGGTSLSDLRGRLAEKANLHST